MILCAKRLRCKQISYDKHNFSFLAYLQKAYVVDDRIESIKISYKRRKKTLVIIGAVISLSVVAIGNWKLDLPQPLRRVITTLLIYTNKHYVQEKHLILVKKALSVMLADLMEPFTNTHI
jgi:hypothetical protein